MTLVGIRTLSDHSAPKAWKGEVEGMDHDAGHGTWETEAQEKEPVDAEFVEMAADKMPTRAVVGHVTGFDGAGGETSVPVAAHLVAPVFDQEIINILDRHGVDEQARTSLRLLAGRFKDAAVDILWRLNRREPYTFGSGSKFVMRATDNAYHQFLDAERAQTTQA